MYTGEEEEEKVDKSKIYTFQKLSHIVQASDEELLEKLKEINAFQLNGKRKWERERVEEW